jgi:hypothetical protein
MNAVTNWPGAESLHFPITFSDAGAVQVGPPAEGHYDQTANTAMTAKEVPVALGHELLDPGFAIPAVALTSLGVAAGIAVGYRINARRTRKAAEAERCAAEGSVGEESAVGDQYKEERISHAAGTLVLDSLLADVDIMDIGKDMNVVVSGKASRVDRIQFDTSEEGVLRLKGPSASHLKANILFSVGGRSWAQRWTGRLTQGWGFEIVGKGDVVKIRATVPAGSKLGIRGVDGNVNAPGNFGDVIVEAASNESVSLGHVGNAEVVSGSYSQVSIKEMDGTLDAIVGYDSRVAVEQGSISRLSAKLADYGKLAIGAEAHDVDVRAGYDSRTRMASVSGDVSLHAADYAQARVEEGHATSLQMTGGYDSRVSFGGSASTALVTSASYGRSSVGKVEGDLTVRGGYDSKTTIGSDSVIDEANVKLADYGKLNVEGHMRSGIVNIGYDGLVRVSSYGRDLRVNRASEARFIIGLDSQSQ